VIIEYSVWISHAQLPLWLAGICVPRKMSQALTWAFQHNNPRHRRRSRRHDLPSWRSG
jgi:hypothetical protein